MSNQQNQQERRPFNIDEYNYEHSNPEYTRPLTHEETVRYLTFARRLDSKLTRAYRHDLADISDFLEWIKTSFFTIPGYPKTFREYYAKLGELGEEGEKRVSKMIEMGYETFDFIHGIKRSKISKVYAMFNKFKLEQNLKGGLQNDI